MELAVPKSNPKTKAGKVQNLHGYMNGEHHDADALSDLTSEPLADLFLETTVMFADIVGFTAWSSAREPSQVFMLLETLYSAFDEIAKQRRVFKIETVGDCYVAATGMPRPRKDHAVAMCRFARGILHKTSILTNSLELTLGPGTSDLTLRIGLHSGPVTAGVLRGEKARFQLFGDTMNTTSRVESNGAPGRVHLSQETANILVSNGKSHWLEKRKDLVQAKGKGLIQTYWLGSAIDRRGSCSSSSQGDTSLTSETSTMPSEAIERDRLQRLIDWNTETLLRNLKQIISSRGAKEQGIAACDNIRAAEQAIIGSETSFLDEVKETINLPNVQGTMVVKQDTLNDVNISTDAAAQLRLFVSCISSLYRDNPFHNFQHASHVMMSVYKLLSRIMEDDRDKTLRDHSCGITSDPLMHFACAFSALIHDVDHRGVPNSQLIRENSPLAAAYKNRSIAEQNSLATAWSLLMDEQFKDLRSTIYTNEAELQLFRQLVVNAVMATDIADKELKALRDARWNRAFSAQSTEEHPRNAVNRKATIVIEHLIQASDVAHTMQHWHIYQKWNKQFFHECYEAYLSGQAQVNPSEGWYDGEIAFFDFYIIPLAKKLKDCGVFGKSSDEYLKYAMANREEWEVRGKDIVAEMQEHMLKTCAYGIEEEREKERIVQGERFLI